MIILENNKILLRNFTYNDVDDFFEYAKNPNVGPNAGWKPHKSLVETLNVLNFFVSEEETWAIVLKENNKVIGSIDLHSDSFRQLNSCRSIGYALSEKYWGQGITLEAVQLVLDYAFYYLKLHLVSVYHLSNNQQSKKVIEKAGFSFEGILRNSLYTAYNDKTEDSYCYSMLKNEFEKIKK